MLAITRRSACLMIVTAGLAAMAAYGAAGSFAAGSRHAGEAPQRHGEGGGCTLASLRGAYSYAIRGSLVAPSGVRAADVAAVGVFRSDGAGHVTGHDVASLNGVILPRQWTATYTVDSDCSGTMSIVTTSQPVTNYTVFLAISSGGRVARAIDTDPGAVGVVTASRQ